MALAEEYARSLALLEGNDFQSEVCARLHSVVIGFQTVPTYPQGDAGLDGLSHSGQRSYCCYGIQHNAFKTPKALENALIKKFCSDLRRLFELEIKGGKLVHKDSPEMATIMAKGQRITGIELICNWFDSHRVLGPIQNAFNEYKKASKCRYVDSAATVVVMGPKELANYYGADENALVRVQLLGLLAKVQQTAETIQVASPGFDQKMKDLREIRPDQIPAIDALAEKLLDSWRTSLAFERELDETLPMLHRTLEEDRRQILIRISELMLSSQQPWTLLDRAHEIVEEILERDFARVHQPLVPRVSSGEIARLIGECPIGWKKARKDLANV